MMKTRFLLLLSLLVIGMSAHAQVACPPGMIPYGTAQDTSACGPDPSAQQSTQSQSHQMQGHWESRWGAIATDAKKGILGTATGMRSKEEASNTAMTECRSKGGVVCAIDSAYDNQCAAMIIGNKMMVVNNDPDLDSAIRKSMKTCNAQDTNCEVYYTDCSLPSLVQ